LVAGSPEGVTTGPVVGGQLDGIGVEIEPGREIVEMGAPFLALFGGPPGALERLRRTRWQYRYAHVDPGEEGPVAIFEFVAEIEVEPADHAAGELGE
jgi:hypothetical protein